MNESEFSAASATTLSQKLSRGDISPLELMDATISRIEAVNPLINALPILCLEKAREQARAMTVSGRNPDVDTALATGNDLGGSLRVPASFNSVVGLRPGPGRVPRGARHPAFDTLWVEGPMGRCVSDVALMLDGGAGCDITDPLSFPHNGDRFLDALEHNEMPKRVAFSSDLGVVLMEDEVASICKSAADVSVR